jgi:hypothetical protein
MFPVYVKDQAFRLPDDPVYYLLARGGLYLVKQNRFFRSATLVSLRDAASVHEMGIDLPQVDTTRLLPQDEEVVATFPPIPCEILKQAVTLFDNIARTYGTEAVALLYHGLQNGEYHLVAPRQRVTDIHARYEVGASPVGLQRVGTLHSHVGDAAFHSDTDMADEQADNGLHIVIGLGGKSRSITCALVVDGRRCSLAPQTLFGDAWEGALAVGGEPSPTEIEGVEPVHPAGPARRAMEARYGILGAGRQVLLIGGRSYNLPEVMLALGLAFEDNHAIDGGEVYEDRLFMIRYFDGETRQVVALEFDPQFRLQGEIRVHIAEWMGDDYYNFPWAAWCPWAL